MRAVYHDIFFQHQLQIFVFIELNKIIIHYFLSHNDFPLTIRDIYQNDFTDLNFDSNLTENPLFAGYSSSHTDLPKLRIGKVGGQVSLTLMT